MCPFEKSWYRGLRRILGNKNVSRFGAHDPGVPFHPQERVHGADVLYVFEKLLVRRNVVLAVKNVLDDGFCVL